MSNIDVKVWIEVIYSCPNCNSLEDVFDNEYVKQAMGVDLNSENCYIEVQCSECGEKHVINNINF